MRMDTIAIVDSATDVDLTDKPFGKRWGQEKLILKPEHLEALRSGKLLALDVYSEYVVFLELDNGN